MRWRNILYNTGFAITCLLVFLLVFESRLSVPVWLQVFGRIHPLFLHIPIGLLLLYAITELLSSEKGTPGISVELRDFLLVVGYASVAATALMGLLLSREEGYDGTGVAAHKWWGTALCIFLMFWYQWREKLRRNRIANSAVALASILTITITGHLGGSVTHGEDYVLGPAVKKSKPIPVKFEEAIVYRDMVHPILSAKCISCHNEKKAKGELVMATPELLQKGGKNGKPWDTASADLGLILKRVHLPLDNDDHMPPAGKPQLTEDEITILQAWIKTGSNFVKKVSELPKDDTLRSVAVKLFKSDQQDQFNFASADDKTIRSLNNFYRVVNPIAENSPALNVRYFNAANFNDSSLQQIEKVKQQVVNVDLSRMPVKDKQLGELAKFTNIRNLNLSFTPINGEGLTALKPLKNLREISLSGTSVNVDHLKALSGFPALKKVYIWNTAITDADLDKLKRSSGKIQYQTGYYGDTVVLKLTPPMIQNDKFVNTEPVELKLKHNINGVAIHYTLDGSEPDSVRSPVFKPGTMIANNVTLKTRAYRKGWISSDVQVARFYLGTIKPDSISLGGPPDWPYPANGAESLVDGQLGTSSLSGTDWLGFSSPKKFSSLLKFNQQTKAKSLILTSYLNKDNSFFAPEQINVWMGNDLSSMKRVASLNSGLPPKNFEAGSTDFEFKLPDQPFKYIRIETKAISGKLPKWFGGPKKTPWMVFDEIVIK